MDCSKVSRFDSAVSFITPNVRRYLTELPDSVKQNVTEVRMRVGKPLMLTTLSGGGFVTRQGRFTLIFSEDCLCVDKIGLNDTFNRMCSFSVHSFQNDLKNGFITLKGGHRVGVCACANVENGEVTGVKDISFLNLRIAGSFDGVADELIKRVYARGLKNIILAGVPSSGKTTMLRDLARQLSSGKTGTYHKVTVADERYEIACIHEGNAFNDVGLNCDVISGFPKNTAVLNAIRSMSPDIIICDEIGDLKDVDAVKTGLNSGVCFAVSVHAESYDDIIRKVQIKELLKTECFDYIVLLDSGSKPCTIKEIYNARKIYGENHTDFDGGYRLLACGSDSLTRLGPKSGCSDAGKNADSLAENSNELYPQPYMRNIENAVFR